MEVNISRTAREADSASVAPSGAAPRTGCWARPDNPSGTGGPSNFRQRGDNHAFRDIVNDLNFADFSRKNEVNRSGFGFLVRPQQLESFRVLYIDIRQRTPGMDGVANALVSSGVAHAHLDCNLRRGLHAPGYSLSVKEMLVFCRGLQGMAKGVPQVEHAPQITFFFVSGNNGGLESHGLGNCARHSVNILAQSFD